MGRHVSAVYRDGRELTALRLLLAGADPDDVVLAAGYLEVVERYAAQVVTEAERVTWSSWGPEPVSGTSASRWTRRPCSRPTPAPGRSWCAGWRPTRCSASVGPASVGGRRCRRRPPPGERCGWSAATPCTRRAPTARAWGGHPDGLIPPSALCPLRVAGHPLRCDAAAAYRAMITAFTAAFGTPLCITDFYRTYASQARLYGEKPALGAAPGTGNHGWGLTVDLCVGVESFATPQYAWMAADAGRSGFLHPRRAGPGNGHEEPWHWEFAGA